MNLESLKVGDCITSGGSWGTPILWKITGETKTQWICSKTRFNKLTGKMIGSSGYSVSFGRIVMPEDLLKIRIKRASERLDKLMVTADNLDAVESLLKAVA